MKEKLCEERRFGVSKTQELPGALPPGPPLGRCPWSPPGALERAPGPHAVKTLRSLRSTWTQTISIQHPAVTNPAHAKALLPILLPHQEIITIISLHLRHSPAKRTPHLHLDCYIPHKPQVPDTLWSTKQIEIKYLAAGIQTCWP